MPYRPPVHEPIRADRPGIAPRQSQAGSFYQTQEWKDLRTRVLARDRYTCKLALPGCGVRASIADHIIARRDGGSDTMMNLRAVCWACHNRRHPERGGYED